MSCFPEPRMEAASPGVNLVEAQRLLSLFAQGISGRYFHLKPLAALKGEFRPEKTTSDGRTLFLPDDVEEFAEPRQNLGFYKVAVMHQLGFFEFETWSFDFDEARRRVPGLASREARGWRAQAGELEMFFACFQEQRLLRRIFGALEDYRVDCGLSRTYPGLQRDLDRAMALALERRGALPSIEGAAGLLEALVRCTLRADLGPLRASDATGLLEAVIDAARRAGDPHADVYTSAEQAVRCLVLLRTAGIEETLGVLMLDEVEGSVEFVDFRGDAPLDLAQLSFRVEATQHTLETLGEAGTAISPDSLERIAEDLGEETPPDELTRALKRRLDSDRVVLRRAFGGISRAERSFLYDEWNYHTRSYLRAVSYTHLRAHETRR